MSNKEFLIPAEEAENRDENIILNTLFKKSKKQLENEEINNNVASKLIKVSIVCGAFMIIEFIGGYIAGSIAIMSDAAHLLSDLAGFIISIVSLYIANKPANTVLTYGYGRYEVIGAMTSILIIWVLTAWLLVEAINRFFNPGEISGLLMVIMSSCGLVFNLILGKILTSENLPNAFETPSEPSSPVRQNNSNDNLKKVNHLDNIDNEKDQQQTDEATNFMVTANKNTTANNLETQNQIEDKGKDNAVLRAAILHILGDMIQSLGVLTAAIIIYLFQETTPKIVYADPCCTIIFAIIVLYTTIPVSRDCIHVLMEATPKNINLKELIIELGSINNVVNIHDIHVWAVSIGKIAISAHILSHTPQKTLEEATKICKKYGIFHETIQVEDESQRRRNSFVVCTHAIEKAIH